MKNTDRPAGKLAFVFEGGGSLAAAQIGMLRALIEDGPRPELVIGTSAGAINAVAFAAYPTAAGVAELEALWLSLHRRDVATLRDLLDDHFADRRLEDVPVPAHVVTTDLASGTAHVISTGPVVEALMASAAMPGLFPSVTIGGRQLVDGALAANTPIRQAVDLGATDIYVLAVATLGRTAAPTAPSDPAPAALASAVDAGTARYSQDPPPASAWFQPLAAQPAIFSTSGTARGSSPRATGSPKGGWPTPSPRPSPRRDRIRHGDGSRRHRQPTRPLRAISDLRSLQCPTPFIVSYLPSTPARTPPAQPREGRQSVTQQPRPSRLIAA